MSNDLPNIPDIYSETDENKLTDTKYTVNKDSKVSYSKTRNSFKGPYKARHLAPVDTEKSRKQQRRENIQIGIRKIKRLNIVATLLTFILLFGLFIGTGILLPKTASSAPVTQTSDSSLTINFLGDMMMGRDIAKLAESKGYDSLFSGMAPLLSSADLTFANLDCAVLKNDVSSYEEVDKETPAYCSYDAVEAARRAGVNVFALANDHTSDYGAKPVKDIISYCTINQIPYHGVGINLEDAIRYATIEQNGYRIAFISITDVFLREASAGLETAGVLSTNYGNFNRLVNTASADADLTIVYFHWGNDGDIARSKRQKNLGRQLIDAGADIVVGTNPHVVHEVEKYKEGIIFNSLGNFINDQGSTFVRDSVVVKLKLDQNGEAEFTLFPVRINDGAPFVTKNPFYKTRIYNELTQGLEESDYYTDNDGFINIKLGRKIDKVAALRAAQIAASQAETTQPTTVQDAIPQATQQTGVVPATQTAQTNVMTTQ